jgi:hypothetical protein
VSVVRRACATGKAAWVGRGAGRLGKSLCKPASACAPVQLLQAGCARGEVQRRACRVPALPHAVSGDTLSRLRARRGVRALTPRWLRHYDSRAAKAATWTSRHPTVHVRCARVPLPLQRAPAARSRAARLGTHGGGGARAARSALGAHARRWASHFRVRCCAARRHLRAACEPVI